MILVLTSYSDRTADRVVAELTRRGEAVERLDTADFPRSIAVNVMMENQSGWNGWLQTERGQIQVDDIGAIYYRRPTNFLFPDDVTGSDLAFAAAEARRGFGVLLFSLRTRWVNHPARIADAEFKPAQLRVAADCGLTVPRTLLTSDPDERRFSARLQKKAWFTNRFRRQTLSKEMKLNSSTPVRSCNEISYFSRLALIV
jgi:hypothetical protein